MPKGKIITSEMLKIKNILRELSEATGPPAEPVPSMLSMKPPASAPTRAARAPASAPTRAALAPADLSGSITPILQKVTEVNNKSPYEIQLPTTFVSSSRRNFTTFITQTFIRYTMPMKTHHIPGDKYPYQKFVREYMRQETPYRGVLVYHGLGTGKTCTSIATAEALYSVSKKRLL